MFSINHPMEDVVLNCWVTKALRPSIELQSGNTPNKIRRRSAQIGRIDSSSGSFRANVKDRVTLLTATWGGRIVC
jgi:hypothetical protein